MAGARFSFFAHVTVLVSVGPLSLAGACSGAPLSSTPSLSATLEGADRA